MNLDLSIDSLTRRRLLEFQILNNDGDNVLFEKEAKLEDIISTPTHCENIRHEIHSRISSKVLPKVVGIFTLKMMLMNFINHTLRKLGLAFEGVELVGY